MARVLLSGLVSDIRGKLNGSVFKRGNAGLIIQNKPASTRKKSGAIVIKDVNNNVFLKSATAASSVVRNNWNNLTETQRATWDALSVAVPVPQKNNNQLFLNGLQTFLKANVVRIMLGETSITAPIIGLSPPAPIEVTGVVVFPTMVVTLSRITLINETIILRVSSSIKNTVRTVGSRTRLMRIQPAVGTNTVDITTPYTAEFGALPSIGDLIFTKISPQDAQSGAQLALVTNRIETT